MNKDLKILFVEDSQDDVFLIERELKKGGYTLHAVMVDTEAALEQALNTKTWEIVLTDYYLPRFSGIKAIACVRKSCPDLPCVMISGKAGEETAVEAMKAGASDFIPKDNLSRLIPVVERELKEAALHRSRRQMENALKEKEEQYSGLFNQMMGALSVHEMIYDDEGKAIDYWFLEVNPAFEKHTGLKASQVINKTAREAIPGVESFWIDKYAVVVAEKKQIAFEDYSAPLNRFFEIRAYPLSENKFATLFHDVTERKTAERNQLLATEILALLNQTQNQTRLVEDILKKFVEFTGVEAAGIRLKKDEDFPFYSHLGFPESFIQQSSKIFSPVVDHEEEDRNNRTPECMCGMIILGKCDKTMPMFTPGGSFFRNSLHDLETYKDRLPCPDNFRTNCADAAYESLALIPLKSGKDVIGVLQFNDKREGFFTREQVLFFENIATSIGIAFKRLADEETIRLDEARLKSLLKISQYRTRSIQDLLDYALSEAIALSNSKIGYIYYYNEQSRAFTLNTWSKEVMKECSVDNPPDLYHLDKTGFWGEVVRQRKAIINNNFHQPHPHKKGYPEGHCEIYRFMSIPVFNGNEIVAVVGLGNKTEDYTEKDVMQLTLLMDVVWKMSEQKRVLQKEKEYYKSLETLSNTAIEFLQLRPEENIFRFISDKLIDLIPYRYFIACSYEAYNKAMKIEYMSGFTSEDLLTFSDELGKNFKTLRLQLIRADLETLKNGQIIELSKNFSEFSKDYLGQNIPTLDHLSEGMQVQTIGLSDDENIFGIIILFLDKEYRINKPLLGTFISQAAASLRRGRILTALKLSEIRLNSLFEKNNDIVFTMNPRETILSINPIGEKLITGKIKPGLKIRNFVTEESYFRLNKMFHAVISAQKEYCVNEIDVITRNQSILTFKVAFSLTYNGRKLLEIFGIARNVTSDKMLENQVLSKIIETEEREKKAFAAELHDGLGSLLSTINIYVGLLQKEGKSQQDKGTYLKELNKLVNDAIANVRLYANSLTPNVLNDFGLISALKLFGEKVNATRPGLLRFDVPELLENLSKIIEINVYRILLELINNSMKYANADSITITIKINNNQLLVSYQDNGTGFEVEEVMLAKTSGMGIRNIFARAKSLNGHCDFNSEPGKGVNIRIDIPLDQKNFT